MQAFPGTYIAVTPETDHERQQLVDFLEHEHCTWHIDEDDAFTIYPVETTLTATHEMLERIKAL